VEQLHTHSHDGIHNKKTSHSALYISVIYCTILGLIWSFIPHPVVIVAFGLMPLGFIFVIKNPFFLVILFVIFSFFRIHEVFPQIYSLRIPLLLSAGAILSLAWHIGISRKIEIFWCRELTVASLFFAHVFVGVFLASNRPVALEYFINIYWKIMVMTFAIAWLVRDVKEFASASSLIIFSGSLVGIVTIKNKLTGVGLVEETRVTIGRDIGSVLGDPNDLALVLMFPCAFAVSLITTEGLSRSKRVLGVIAVLILFFAVISTQSRGGLLGVLAIFGLYGYQKIKSKVLLGCIGGVFAIFLFVFAGISDRKSGGAAEEGLDSSAQGRLYAWEAAVGMATDNPISGVGLDNFYSNYYFYSPHWDGLNHAVHSTWFGVLAETGYLGFILFVTLIVCLVKSILKSRAVIKNIKPRLSSTTASAMEAATQATFAGLVGTIISGTFLTHGFTWPIYILSGLVIALSRWTSAHANA